MIELTNFHFCRDNMNKEPRTHNEVQLLNVHSSQKKDSLKIHVVSMISDQSHMKQQYHS